MSVILYERDTFGKLADWLVLKDKGRDPFFDTFTYDEKADIYWTENRIWSGRDFDVREYRRSKLAQWADRLFIANQLAFFYTYDVGDTKLERLDDKDIDRGSGMTGKMVLEILEGIHYNIYTNGGNCFLGKKDEKKLGWYIRQLKDGLLRMIKGA